MAIFAMFLRRSGCKVWPLNVEMMNSGPQAGGVDSTDVMDKAMELETPFWSSAGTGLGESEGWDIVGWGGRGDEVGAMDG